MTDERQIQDNNCYEPNKIGVHRKLMEARIKLQNTSLKKSGLNKFSKYTYFELADFLPAINSIFKEVGLCGYVSYGAELATLTITDLDNGSEIAITSPMAEASLKGNHPIQNLGAVETYSRRYLWMTALEIVEHDALDSGEAKGESVKRYDNIGEALAALSWAQDMDDLKSLYKSVSEQFQNDKESMTKIKKLAREVKTGFESDTIPTAGQD